jgi:hypothetical protein
MTPCSVETSNLDMLATYFTETFVPGYHTTRSYVPEIRNHVIALRIHHCNYKPLFGPFIERMNLVETP